MPETALPTEISVDVKGFSFTFKIPNLHDEIKLGIKSKAIRTALAGPDGDAGEDGLDSSALYSARACAAFEVLLLRSGAAWVFTTSKTGTPVVDTSKIPPDKAGIVVDAYFAFLEKLRSFREGGNPDQPTVVAQALAG